MAYLGTPPQSGFITTAKQRVTSSTNNYVDLDHAISSIADVIVFVNFVKQDTTNLTLTTSTRITLGGTLVSSDIVEIHYLGKAVNTQTPGTGTVTNDMLAGSIANSKLANSSITLNGSAVSLGGSATISSNAGTEAFNVTSSASQSASDNTYTQVTFATEDFDNGNNFASNTYTVPSNGQYFFHTNVYIQGNNSHTGSQYVQLFYKNGSAVDNARTVYWDNANETKLVQLTTVATLNLSANDTIKVYAKGDINNESVLFYNRAFGGFKIA